MGLLDWLHYTPRPLFWMIDAVRVERLARHRLHLFGVYPCNTSRIDSMFGDDYKTQRHSVLDLETGTITDGFERSLLHDEELEAAEFIAQARRSAPGGAMGGDLIEPKRSTLEVRFGTADESDTQKPRAPLLDGLRITRDARYRFDAVLLRGGERVSHFAMEGAPSEGALRVLSIPDATRALLLTNGYYYWLDLATGKVVRKGQV